MSPALGLALTMTNKSGFQGISSASGFFSFGFVAGLFCLA